MRTWVIKAGGTGTDALTMVERDVPKPGPGEILIRVRACSLNYRDQAIVRGTYMGGPVPNDTIPLSDGDSVIVIKDLKVKGSSSVVKGGTKVRNIRLTEASDGHNIACKIDGIGAMNLKSEFVKKA